MARTPTGEKVADLEVRRRIRQQLDESQLVEAAAGTGKTRVLVERLLEVLRRGRAELVSTVVVTFTEKAAGELKLRVREELERLRRRADEPDERQRLQRAVQQLEEAHIGTIHGFCADLLREYPVEAGVDPAFEVTGEGALQSRLFDRVFQRWFEAVRHDPPPGVARVLSRPSAPGQPSAAAMLRRGAWQLAEHRDLDRRWTRRAFDPSEALDAVAQQLRAALDLAERAEGPVARQLQNSLRAADEALQRCRPEEIEARIWGLRRRLRDLRRPLERQGRRLRAVQHAVQQLAQGVESFCQAAGAALAPLLQEELWQVLQAYEAQKTAAGRLDFTDLLLKARDLLRGNERVRVELQRRFQRVFVDEFQDTDPLQAELLLLLAAEAGAAGEYPTPAPGKLFAVGDPKQSIYRFRRAEIELYETIKRRLTAEGVVLLQLTSSFRAVPGLQQAINAAFAPLMAQQATGGSSSRHPGYVPLTPHRPPLAGQPALVALPLAAPDEPQGYSLRAREPKIVAGWIEWLLGNSGWRVSGRQGDEAVAPHHVCLLLRNLRSGAKDLTAPYAQEFERRGIPHQVIGGRSFFVREEVDALRVALRAVEWPDDQLSVFAALRGPLFGIDDETLLRFREGGGRFHTRRSRSPEGEEIVRDALELLGDLHPGRNHRSPAETIALLLARTRCLTGLALRPAGAIAVRSALHLQRLAHLFQQSEGLSFRAFVEYLEQQADAALADADTSAAEDEAGGVRLMTVHRAKGLEFPVVVLADAACRVGQRSPGSISDRPRNLYACELCEARPAELTTREAEEAEHQLAEEQRLLYVAATRARDLLVVPAIPRPESYRGWLAPLMPVVDSRLHLADGVAGCPSWSSAAPGALRVEPGLHRPRAGSHQVVWWDADLLSSSSAEGPPLRHWDLLEAGGPEASGSVQRYQQWCDLAERRRRLGREPLCEVRAATAVAHDERSADLLPLAGTAAVELAESSLEPAMPPGPRRLDPLGFGTLVHAVLETVDLGRVGRDAEQLAAAVQLAGRRCGGSAADLEAATTQVRAALDHPLLRAAAGAALRFREVPIALRLGADRALVEGIVDLVFLDADGVLQVVDYKTDSAPSAAQLEAYRRQVVLYLGAIGEATGLPVRGHLLFV